MNAQHTQGPWHAEKDQDGSHMVIDDMRSMDPIYVDQSPPTNSEANARLIAAAPRLLAALEAMLTVGQPEGLREMARAAIAKATAA